MDEPKYPDIHVRLTGVDGNALSLVGAVKRALRTAHVDQKEIEEFQQEALSGDYDHVIQTCMKWVDVS
jgi:hypothetical protein